MQQRTVFLAQPFGLIYIKWLMFCLRNSSHNNAVHYYKSIALKNCCGLAYGLVFVKSDEWKIFLYIFDSSLRRRLHSSNHFGLSEAEALL
jgi:hypothetical protein